MKASSPISKTVKSDGGTIGEAYHMKKPPNKLLARRQYLIRRLPFTQPTLIKKDKNPTMGGPVDQSGRSSASHAEGPGFKSPPVHSKYEKEGGERGFGWALFVFSGLESPDVVF
jgi:hypothetical protein